VKIEYLHASKYGNGAMVAEEKLRLPAGTKYAVLTTEMAPQPDRKTGWIPTDAELVKWQRVRPIINELLQGAGLVKVAEDKVLVTGLQGAAGGGLAAEGGGIRGPDPARSAGRRQRS
jgi:hypothetical protein